MVAILSAKTSGMPGRTKTLPHCKIGQRGDSGSLSSADSFAGGTRSTAPEGSVESFARTSGFSSVPEDANLGEDEEQIGSGLGWQGEG